jgi:hypothetical protein
MKPAFRIILALSFSLAACGHSKPDLFLDQSTTALGCGSSNARDCGASGDADAGSPPPELDGCYADGDCEYGEVCERRHGVSLCQPEDGRHGDDDGDGYGGYGGDDSSSDDDGHDGHGGDDRPDGGAAACDAGAATDDHPKGSDDCYRDDEDQDRHEDEGRHEDRSGSNSGRH